MASQQQLWFRAGALLGRAAAVALCLVLGSVGAQSVEITEVEATKRASVTVSRKPLPDFQITLRQIRASDADFPKPADARWTSAGDVTPALTPLQVRVRSGETARWQLRLVQPLQWTQSVQAHATQLRSADTDASSLGGAVTQGLVLVESGMELRVTPFASAGRGPVRLDVEVRTQTTGTPMASQLPASQRQAFATSVSVPLGQWVSLASSGAPVPRGTFRSDAAQDREETVLQVQVRLP